MSAQKLLDVGAIPPGLCQCGCGERTTLVTESNSRLGRFKGQPNRYVAGHKGRRSEYRYEVEDRGFSTPCWVWKGSIDKRGYGRLRYKGEQHKTHRFFYEYEFGSIPEGLELDHLCRVKACCRPDHLEAVTHLENVRRGAKPKLNAEKARQIKASSESLSVLAKRYDVDKSTINNVRRGVCWADV